MADNKVRVNIQGFYIVPEAQNRSEALARVRQIIANNELRTVALHVEHIEIDPLDAIDVETT